MHNVATDSSQAATFGRAMLIESVDFLEKLSQTELLDTLNARLRAEDQEGSALRQIIILNANITPAVTRRFADPILRAISEATFSDEAATRIAPQILRPAIAELIGDSNEGLAISGDHVNRILIESPANRRQKILELIAAWQQNCNEIGNKC